VNAVEFYVNVVNAVVSRHKPYRVRVCVYGLDEAIILNARRGNDLNKATQAARYNYTLVTLATCNICSYHGF
jgi:hypothetical protein